MRKPVMVATFTALVAGSAAAWNVQNEVQEEQAGLLSRAAVPVQTAQQTALAAYPGARIDGSEIEEEGGRLIYSFELDVPGQGGVEVEVDAMTGELLPAEFDDDDGPGDDDDGPGNEDGRRG
jgi:uncharacterized membrane protein YkoI